MSTISKHYTLLYKHVKTADYTFSYLVSTISNTTLFVYKHVKIASIKQNVHYIKHYTLLHFSLQTVHYIKWLHFCYTNMSKIASIPKCPLYLYQSLHFCIQNCQNCVHNKMSTISNTTICYTFLMKVYVKWPNLRTSYFLDNFPNESLCKMTKFAHLLFSWQLS
jgi:hypothetical protein